MVVADLSIQRRVGALLVHCNNGVAANHKAQIEAEGAKCEAVLAPRDGSSCQAGTSSAD